jgi:hypothetical protein
LGSEGFRRNIQTMKMMMAQRAVGKPRRMMGHQMGMEMKHV